VSFLKRVFGKAEPSTDVEDEVQPLECPHTRLLPRWDSVQDMGKEEKATGYVCEGCGQIFTPEGMRSREVDDFNRWRKPTDHVA
jgi:hypothetical protein